jgi:phosphatidylglycerophosphate synthase
VASVFARYRASLKEPVAEELADLVFFRPLAFLFVNVLARFPVTPNQISLCAMAVGIASGWYLSGGDRSGFFIGGLLYLLFNILDCCDGMIARLKHNGTKTGRIVDGVVDYVAGIAAYTGLGIGCARAVHAKTLMLPFDPWLLLVAAAMSAIAHMVVSDNYRNAWLRMRKGVSQNENELVSFSNELDRLDQHPGYLFDKLLIRMYLRYLRIQGSGKAAGKESVPVPVIMTPAKVIAWNLIGPSTHIVFFSAAALLFRPMVFFGFVIGAANLLMIAFFLFFRTRD